MASDMDFSAFEKMAKGFDAAVKQFPKFLEDFMLEMAYRVIARVKPRTPVDTGFLREDWDVGEITRVGNKLEAEILNGTEYASMVEYGHRIVSHGVEIGWQDGRFMLTISIDEIQWQLPARFERQFAAFLRSFEIG